MQRNNLSSTSSAHSPPSPESTTLDLMPLSAAQLSIWLGQMLDLDDPIFSTAERVEITGELDAKSFELVLRKFAAATDALQLQFVETDDGPRQFFQPDLDWKMVSLDFTKADSPVGAAESWIAADLARTYKMHGEPLFRFALLRVAPDRHYWYFNFHHVVIDGVSFQHVVTRCAAAYTALVKGTGNPQFANPSWRQALEEDQAYRNSDDFVSDKEFWTGRLANRPQSVSLSGKPPAQPERLIRTSGYLPASVDVEAVGRQYSTSPTVVVATAVALHLHFTTGARDMLVGVLASARVGATLRDVVGVVANTFPLRISVSPDDRVADVIRRTEEELRACVKHQRYRIEDLRRDLHLRPDDREFVRTIFNSMPREMSVPFGDCSTKRNLLANGLVDDLQIVFHRGNESEGHRIGLTANRELYSDADIGRHCDRLIDLVAAVAAASPDDIVSSLGAPNVTIERDTTAQQSVEARGARKNELGLSALATQTELAIAEIWKEVLRLPAVQRGDDFFDIGGDSLLANMLMTRVRKVFALDLPLKFVFENPTLQGQANRIDAARTSENSSPAPHIAQFPDDREAPLSFSQHRMWLIQSLDAANTAYNISGALRLTGKLDVDALSRAVEEIYQRHDILRTSYGLVGAEIVQRVHDRTGEPFEVFDLAAHDDPFREAKRRADEFAAIPIDLSKGPGFRVNVMRLGTADHLLQVTVHHVASDMWSMGVLMRELASIYNASIAGGAAKLPPMPIRYRDYAAWQQDWLQKPELVAQLNYWRRALEGVQPLELPTDRQRPRIQNYKGSLCQAPLPAALMAKLDKLGQSQSATLFMTMFAGFSTLLHRLSGQSNFAIGVPVAGRTHRDVEQVVGTFVNTLALRANLADDPTFSELLSRVRATTLDGFANQDIPFDKLVQDLAQTRDASRAPIVQTMFNMGNAPMHGIEFDGTGWEYVHVDRGGAQFELSMWIDTQLSNAVVIEYNTELFERETIERFIERYLCVLEAAVSEPDKRLSELDVISASERQLLLKTWNATDTPLPQQTFIAAFEARALEKPDEPAVTFEGITLSYRELASRTGTMARELKALGVGRGGRVGVSLNRSLEMLVALLAVQKSGAAYVPLDPALPLQRLAYMMSDSTISVLVTSADVAAKLEIPPGVTVFDIAMSDAKQESDTASGATDVALTSDAAYIIYTSGSTGKPKGVAVSHGALANFLASMQKQPGLAASDVLAAVTTISFDIAGLELYLPLLVGARIELVPTSTAGDGVALAELLRTSGATLMQATPATWGMLLDAEWKGSPQFRALCGGEPLSRDLANTLLRKIGSLWNLYGPTETTIWSTATRVEAGDGTITVGTPIDNTQVYILNGMTVAPIGIGGEICIGGAGVAIGYYCRPELTEERFVANPFVADTAARIYRTGDLGRWGNDGKIYHLGRMDHQVKIRGFRIELGEVEAVIRTNPAVKEAVVVAHEVRPDDKRLVAYVIYEKQAELTVSELRRFLRQELPEYMVPSLAITLDRFPLTPNGKLDRSSLPDPFLNSARQSHTTEPLTTGQERMVAAIWRDLLKVEQVGAGDNFFDLGGYSLLALRCIAQIETQTGKRLDPRLLFFHKLREIAVLVPDESRVPA